MEKSYSSRCNITQQLDDLFFDIQLYYKYTAGYKLFLVDLKFSICDHLRNKVESKVMELVWPTLNKYLTVAGRQMRCPVMGEFLIKKLPFNGDFVQNIFLPVGDYMLNVTFLTSSMEFIWNGKFFVNIPAGKTIEDDRMGR